MTVAIQKIISWAILNEMRDKLELDEERSRLYSGGEPYPALDDNYLLNTAIRVPDKAPDLDLNGQGRLNDAENALKIYAYLGRLTRTQAADLRLWVTLTHTIFWDYCLKRWPAAEKSSDYVLEHWFEKRGGGLAALRRNAISRLWWAAHLTVAPWERDSELNVFKSSDRARYTRVLLSQQQIFSDVIERSYGSNLRIRICLLDALAHFLPKMKNKDNLSKDVSINMSLLLKHRQLDAMPLGELKQQIYELVKASAERQTHIAAATLVRSEEGAFA